MTGLSFLERHQVSELYQIKSSELPLMTLSQKSSKKIQNKFNNVILIFNQFIKIWNFGMSKIGENDQNRRN